MAAGYGEPLFWSSTPRQFALHMAAANDRAIEKHNAFALLAYTIVNLPNMKPKPKLSDLQIRASLPSKQTPEDRLRMAKQVAAMSRR